jgi:predicted ribosomally synthesized peptide with nif11-like leader
MSREAIEQLIDRWMDDPEFRAAVRQDPEGTVRATGLELTQDELAALRAVDWNLSDEELTARASRAVGFSLDSCG